MALEPEIGPEQKDTKVVVVMLFDELCMLRASVDRALGQIGRTTSLILAMSSQGPPEPFAKALDVWAERARAEGIAPQAHAYNGPWVLLSKPQIVRPDISAGTASRTPCRI